MKKLVSVLMLLVLTFALSACGGSEQSEEALSEDAAVEQTDVIEDIQEDEVDLSNIGEPWPKDVPADVPVLKGLTITTVLEEANARTIMFECDDKEVIRAYVAELAAAGFTQDGFTENDFALDYTGNKGNIKIFINCVPGNISKLDIRY